MPKLAQEAHVRAMESTVRAALEEACIGEDQLEGVAVTIGPGLSLCLQAIPLTRRLIQRMRTRDLQSRPPCMRPACCQSSWRSQQSGWAWPVPMSAGLCPGWLPDSVHIGHTEPCKASDRRQCVICI